jgi:hypothetical protein
MKNLTVAFFLAASIATLATAAPLIDATGDWHDSPPPRYEHEGVVWSSPSAAWLVENAGWRETTPEEIAAKESADAQAAIDAEQARVASLAQSYGGIVAALRHYLVVVGWDIPCDATQVTADLMMRSIADTLTDDQVRAQGNIADLYILLQGQSVSNADIAAIWEAIQ